MKVKHLILSSLFLTSLLIGCAKDTAESSEDTSAINAFLEMVDCSEDHQFTDNQANSYNIVDFDKLSVDQKKLVYYMSQAGCDERDIIYVIAT